MRYTVTRLLLMALPLLLANYAFAQKTPWAPIQPSAIERDWIKLSSGEWLWGEIDLLRDESLSFDSEKLDDVIIDWEDIIEIRSARILTYVMTNGVMVTGTSALKNSILHVNTNEGEIEIPHKRIQSILEGPPTELNFWSAKISGNLKSRTGNTTQNDYGVVVNLAREAARSRLDFKYVGNFSKSDENMTVDNRKGNAEWKVFLSRYFFITPARAEFFMDSFQNIKLRSTTGAGIGYYFIRNSKTDWFVDIGASYQNTKFNSVLPDEDDNESVFSLPLRTTIETEITSTVDLTAEYSIQLGFGENSNTIQHTYFLLEFDLIGDIDFNASLTWDHASNPKTNSNGITPKKDDVAMAYGLSVDF